METADNQWIVLVKFLMHRQLFDRVDPPLQSSRESALFTEERLPEGHDMLIDISPAAYAAGVTGIAAITYTRLHYRLTSIKNQHVDRVKTLVKKDPEAT